MNSKKISFPHIGNYYIPIKYILENITKCKVIIPPLNNNESVSIGSLYSPNDICMPFKYNLGNYIFALRNGANILIQAGGGCRYGFFAELQEQILKELGYNFSFINLIKNNHISLKKLYTFSKSINPKLNIIKYAYYLINGFILIIIMDKLAKYYRENYAKTSNPILFNKVNNQVEKKYLSKNLNLYKIAKLYINTKKEYKKIPINKNIKPLQVLLIGELFSLMDSAASNNLERNLLKEKIVVYRYTDLTYLLFKKKLSQSHVMSNSIKYLKYSLGADGAESVSNAIKHCKKGIDGIIHIKSYSCVPELNAMPILNKISEEYHVPILYLSFDSDNSIANIDTKMEAFYDMIKAKKNK